MCKLMNLVKIQNTRLGKLLTCWTKGGGEKEKDRIPYLSNKSAVFGQKSYHRELTQQRNSDSIR